MRWNGLPSQWGQHLLQPVPRSCIRAAYDCTGFSPAAPHPWSFAVLQMPETAVKPSLSCLYLWNLFRGHECIHNYETNILVWDLFQSIVMHFILVL